MILVDAHVHIHDCYNLSEFFDSAYSNFENAAKIIGRENDFTPVILLTEISGKDYFHQLANNAEAKSSFLKSMGNWSVISTDESCSLIIRSGDNKDLFLISGRQVITKEGFEIIKWRKVPTNNHIIGNIARASEPIIEQIFIAPKIYISNQDVFERKLYIIRKQIEKRVRESYLPLAKMFYIVSLSCKTLIYKGMLTSTQLRQYFLDLQNNDLESAIALVHSRFSTNTFPTWDLAQPFRILAHNGEINTIKANRFWLHASEYSLESSAFGDEIRKILPVIEPEKSDSASQDNALELLIQGGRSLAHALMMLIPESFNMLNPIPDNVKYFYESRVVFIEILEVIWDGIKHVEGFRD